MLGAIFDMDGVLVDNSAFHFQAWQEVLKLYGVQLTRQDYLQELSGKTPEESGRTIFADRLSSSEIRELNTKKETLYRSLYGGSVTAVPGLVPFMHDLDSAGIPMALATSATPENVELILSATGTRRFFASIVDATMVRRGKPEPEIFIKAAKDLGRKPEECVVFEDSKFGLAAARASGAKVVALATTLRPDQIMCADRIIRDFTEIGVGDLYHLFEAAGERN
jgi:beta-phosphoglucomutase family hydrolase